MKARLQIAEGPQSGRSCELGGKESFTIGRVASNDLTLRDRGVSRRHCRIDFDGERFWLLDCDSSNGTYLNGREVSNSLLYDGDVIRLGEARLVFSLTPSEPAGQAPSDRPS
ncbi:MAG: FHA domain-containing protein [Candidatus Brocadiaceae bacterium]|jgi:pSer/pThr/pTyr-binding forkhead associated (FHA) protein